MPAEPQRINLEMYDPPSWAGAGSAWPIGAVFISTVATNPATLLGFGTWAAFGAGRVLVGLNAADADFDVVEETGGAKTVAAAGTNSVPTFSGSALGTHAHGAGTLVPSAHAGAGVDAHSAHAGAAVDAHGVTQPSAHTMSGTGEAVSAGTPAGTVTAPAFTGSATSVVQPYIVVYMFKRVS